MGRFPVADAALARIWICRKCKARNVKGVERCRRCGYTHLRPKRIKRREKA